MATLPQISVSPEISRSRRRRASRRHALRQRRRRGARELERPVRALGDVLQKSQVEIVGDGVPLAVLLQARRNPHVVVHRARDLQHRTVVALLHLLVHGGDLAGEGSGEDALERSAQLRPLLQQLPHPRSGHGEAPHAARGHHRGGAAHLDGGRRDLLRSVALRNIRDDEGHLADDAPGADLRDGPAADADLAQSFGDEGQATLLPVCGVVGQQCAVDEPQPLAHRHDGVEVVGRDLAREEGVQPLLLPSQGRRVGAA
mmetsp:Transcript_62910/g.174030  ORF Transcript_62910/g.174030 Transcript_62910/m.174030 type:complete len:258 (-) Transcript_62910:236-1009(-)